MAVNISANTAQIRTAVYGKEVRESIASGLDTMAADMNQYEENLSSDNDDFKDSINAIEAQHTQAESARVTAETARASAETTRQANETNRQTAEASRVTAESNRETAFASMTHVDANLELSSARQGKDSLLANLQDKDNQIANVNSQLAEKANQADLNTTNSNVALKANQNDLNNTNSNLSATNTNVSNLQAQVTSLASGSPKGTFTTLTALQTDTNANTADGKKNIYVVASDGHWYYWNGTTWRDGGTYQSTGIVDDSIQPEKINNTTNSSYTLDTNNLLSNVTITNGKYIKDDGTEDVAFGNNVFDTDFIPIMGNTRYLFSTLLINGGCWYDTNKNFISRIGTGGKETNVIKLSPITAAYLRWNGDTTTIQDTIYKVLTSKWKINWLETENSSKWSNKIWNAIGDSITEHNNRTNKNYQDYISDKISCTVNNYGVSGTGWRTPSSSGGTNAIYERIPAMNDADLITVFAGTNDYGEVGLPFVLGTFGDTTTSTFYGAVDYCLNLLINKYPTKTLAVFTPLPDGGMWGTKSYTMQQVADAIIQVCNKYSIPVLDLFRINNLNINNTDAKNYYFKDPQGQITLHPNDNGHQKLADKILAFLNTL